MPHVVLGVCGGVAAYKSIELLRLFTQSGWRVTPVLTDNALRFVGAATFDALATDRAVTSLFDDADPSPHTTLGQSADVIVVAPATARLIGAYAHGLSNDLLSTTLLATRAPVVLAPAMHTEMWVNPAVVDNIALLRSRGVTIVDPESGPLAGGDWGVGRLATVDNIYKAVILRAEHAEPTTLQTSFVGTASAAQTQHDDLAGKHVLVTAGGTREPIDPVRFIGNRSSGKQGYAVAEEARDRGADVTLITASELPPPAGVKVISVETAQQMYDAVLDELPTTDIVVMAAAVADFQSRTVQPHKIKKTGTPLQVNLEATPDILVAVAERRTYNQVIVGFAAETQDLETHAKEKLLRKHLDVMVANDVSKPGSGFGGDNNEALILDKNGRKLTTGLVEKRTVAAKLFDQILSLGVLQ